MGKMEDRMMEGLKQLMPQQAQEDIKKKPKPVKKAGGGMMKKGYAKGGMMKKGYAKGGMMKKGYAKGGKVRGAGRASKGVRPAKMVTMRGS